MVLSIDTILESTQTNENVSPLGKRKFETQSEACRSGKRSPLSDVSRQNDVLSKPTMNISVNKSVHIKITAPHNSSCKFIPRVSKEEVEATDEGRASVNKLSAWLASESAKKTKKPTTIVPAANPVRFRMKPKINKEDVEATNEKRVSVKTLSAWISDDPFEQKKLRHIRSGARVINKARVFESEKRRVDVQVEAGSVNEKQAWLSGAFRQENYERPRVKDTAPIIRPYQIKSKSDSPDMSLKSVNEKKEWLNNAFKKNNNGIEQVKSFDSANSAQNILKCSSMDDANEKTKYPSTCQPESDVNAACVGQGSKSPPSLYKSTEPESDSPQSCLKTVHDKQEWLSTAFKAKTTSHFQADCTSERKSDLAAFSFEDEAETKDVERQRFENDSNDGVVSVADRAKWLRGAFNK